MRGVGMNANVPMTKGFEQFNQRMLDEPKELRIGVTGDRQGLLEEEELRFNEDAENVDHGCRELVDVESTLPRQQQEPQGPQVPVIKWDKFLPLRSLKVLLVENDDSTRHLVSALLRNCSYEVKAVTNGQEAWKILEDMTYHIDLVLTEVVVPLLSGVGLLCKIMNHRTFKNIPVIMMSSNDSMGIVFACLSKGAVDFLVKPIRKNELKNLWQHVWRKCHSSSGSGSESAIRIQKSTKSGSEEGLDNNIGSSDEDDNGNFGLNIRNGSDNGSGTQGSWTKRAVEVHSSKPISSWDTVPSPCPQVIHSRPEAFNSNWVPTTASREPEEQDDELVQTTLFLSDGFGMRKDLKKRAPGNNDLQLEGPTKKLLTSVAGTSYGKHTIIGLKNDVGKPEEGNVELESENPKEPREEAANLIDSITNSAIPQSGSVIIEIQHDSKIINIKDKVIHETKQMPSLELSLRRMRDTEDNGISLQDNVLRHSDLSAFSRYNTTSAANQSPTANVGSCSPVDNSSEAGKTESMQNLQSNSNGTPNQRSNGSSNNNDMGSTTINAFNQQETSAEKVLPNSMVNLHPSALQPVQSGHVPSLEAVVPFKTDAGTVNTAYTSTTEMQQQVQVQHHHHHYHHYHHHVHDKKQKQKSANHDHLATARTEAAQKSDTDGGVSIGTEGNAANFADWSASGSNNGSNVQNGSNGQNDSSTGVTNGGTNMGSDNGVAGKCGPEGGSGWADQNWFTHREAALNKFRQKRKERCFEKKVRYESRKKMAEQRPRVRGQFVRQVEHGSKDPNS